MISERSLPIVPPPDQSPLVCPRAEMQLAEFHKQLQINGPQAAMDFFMKIDGYQILDDGSIRYELVEKMRRVACRRVPLDIADDLVQEVLTRIYSSCTDRNDLLPNAHLSGLAFRILHNLINDNIRKLSNKEFLPFDESFQVLATEDPESKLLQAELLENLRSALHILREQNPRFADVIKFRFLDKMSIEDSANSLGISKGATKALQHRALDQLRIIISGPNEIL